MSAIPPYPQQHICQTPPPVPQDAWINDPYSAKFDGKAFTGTSPMSLPNLCIKCGQTVDGKRRKRSLHWVPPWTVILLFLLSPIIWVLIVALCQKRLRLEYHECSSCRSRRHLYIFLDLLGWIGGIAVIVFGAMQEDTNFVICGVVLLLLGLIMLPLIQFPLGIASHAKGYFTVKAGRKLRNRMRAQQQNVYSGMSGRGW